MLLQWIDEFKAEINKQAMIPVNVVLIRQQDDQSHMLNTQKKNGYKLSLTIFCSSTIMHMTRKTMHACTYFCTHVANT